MNKRSLTQREKIVQAPDGRIWKVTFLNAYEVVFENTTPERPFNYIMRSWSECPFDAQGRLKPEHTAWFEANGYPLELEVIEIELVDDRGNVYDRRNVSPELLPHLNNVAQRTVAGTLYWRKVEPAEILFRGAETAVQEA